MAAESAAESGSARLVEATAPRRRSLLAGPGRDEGDTWSRAGPKASAIAVELWNKKADRDQLRAP